MLEELRQEVCEANKELPRQRLVTMTSGNVSGRDPKTGLVAIKPSGVSFEDLTPETIVIVDPEGKVVEGRLKPSVDTATHLVIFAGMKDVNSVIHTHSNYATAFAACGRPIPVYLTAMADEFGGPIPCGGFARIGGEEIGREVVKTIGTSRACLLQNHGVFVIGTTIGAALKTAVMVEDIAKTTLLAFQLGMPHHISEVDVQKLYERYHTKYGQG